MDQKVVVAMDGSKHSNFALECTYTCTNRFLLIVVIALFSRTRAQLCHQTETRVSGDFKSIAGYFEHLHNTKSTLIVVHVADVHLESTFTFRRECATCSIQGRQSS